MHGCTGHTHTHCESQTSALTRHDILWFGKVKPMLCVLKLHFLYCPPGGESSGVNIVNKSLYGQIDHKAGDPARAWLTGIDMSSTRDVYLSPDVTFSFKKKKKNMAAANTQDGKLKACRPRPKG